LVWAEDDILLKIVAHDLKNVASCGRVSDNKYDMLLLSISVQEDQLELVKGELLFGIKDV